MFNLPLEAYLQTNSPRETRGSILAASNFLTFSGMILANGLFMLLRSPVSDAVGAAPRFSAQEIFLVCGLATIPVLGYILWLIPQACLRFTIWLLVKCVYRLRVFNAERIPAEGPVLLASNHVSFIDAVLIVLSCDRPVRMFAWAGNFENAIMRKLANQWGVILVTSNPKSIKRALDTAHQALLSGEVVCIFPEGAITVAVMSARSSRACSRSWKDQRPGDPVYLDQHLGKHLQLRRGQVLLEVAAALALSGEYPLWRSIASGFQHRHDPQCGFAAECRVVNLRMRGRKNVAYDAIVGMRRRGKLSKFADSTGVDLNGRNALLRTLALRRAVNIANSMPTKNKLASSYHRRFRRLSRISR